MLLPVNSNLTLPRPLKYISSSLSISNTPAVSTEKAVILEYGREEKSFFLPVTPCTLTAIGQYVTYILLHYPATIYNNLTIGLISDCYITYSYLGIIVIMFIFSKLLKKIELLGDYYNGGYVQGVYLTFSRVIFTFMEGDVASKTISLIIVLLAMIFLKFVLGFNGICQVEESKNVW